MTGDLKCLSATWPELSEKPLKMEGMLDLLKVHQKVPLSHQSCSFHKQSTISFFLSLPSISSHHLFLLAAEATSWISHKIGFNYFKTTITSDIFIVFTIFY